jgi:hypothetical protein
LFWLRHFLQNQLGAFPGRVGQGEVGRMVRIGAVMERLGPEGRQPLGIGAV